MNSILDLREKMSKKKYTVEVNVDKDKKMIIIMNFIFIYYANIFRKETLHRFYNSFYKQILNIQYLL